MIQNCSNDAESSRGQESRLITLKSVVRIHSPQPISVGVPSSEGSEFMIIESNKQKGNAGLSLAIAYFGTNDYTVSLPLNDTQWYDLIVEKDGIFQTVQCKFTSSKLNTISLTSCGGTRRTVYDNILNHPLDLLFCADKDMNMWLIPMDDLRKSKNIKQISLRKGKLHGRARVGIDTTKYCVSLS